ncbi:YrhK family protein [Rhodovulum marinum]|uniref:YrhK-like protein n=1 Tax=Rhodovulum marinum TaxID=320662 RepID=A0A4R2Q8T9_9RHOB|nr:YrhK family protein [Rhodovulum marinum]TCP44438.1 YrhK-like protein [Rhodovulum marinum]
MQLFQHQNRERNAETRRVYAAYEIAHTAVDFAAALCFLVGSVLFFWQSLETPAIWLFVIGSGFFFLKPSIRLAREIRLWRMGRVDTLAARAEQE